MLRRLVSMLRGKRAVVHPSDAWAEPLEERRLLAVTPLTGPGGYDPSPLVETDDVYYFTASDGNHGRELWKTDGTRGGTALVKDILPGPPGSSPRDLTAVGDRLYFLIDDDAAAGTGASTLWTSDGTAAGTTPVHQFPPTADHGTPRQLTAAGGRLYFTRSFRGLEDAELWTSDGTSSGTTLLKSYYAGEPTWARTVPG